MIKTVKSCVLEMAQRRRDMLRYYRLGLSAKEFCVNVATKYGVSEAAVLRDWGKRKEWMKTFHVEENTQSLVCEMLLDYEGDCEEISRLIENETDTAKLIQLYHLKEKVRGNRKEFLFKIGVFDSVKFDFERQAQDKARKLFEKRYPWVIGNKRFYNGAMALAKYRGKLSIIELMELEDSFYSFFLGKGFVKPSAILTLRKIAAQNQRNTPTYYRRR